MSEENSAANSLRDQLRAATLGSSTAAERLLVEYNGQQFEVRPPTLAQAKRMDFQARDKKTGELDAFKSLVLGIINCVYVPGTNERVFEAADEAALMERTPKSFVGAFANAIKEVTSTDTKVEEAAGN